MIVVDSAALLAIYFDELERPAFSELIVAADGPLMGAPNFLEAAMVVEGRHGEIGGRQLDAISANLGLQVVAFEADQMVFAREAFRRFGKGRHKASLNFGDCCAYALAKTLDWPLLFKGADFALTDIKRAL